MSVGSAASSKGSTRRPVARRACLSCREKKIKCDGEALSNESKSTNFTDKQEADGDAGPRICSNCKMLGTDCVFVQSMRGGRRKKRSVTDDESSRSNRSSRSQDELGDSGSASSWGESMDKYNSASFEPEKWAPRSSSPTLSYNSTPHTDVANKLKSSEAPDSRIDTYGQNSYPPEEYSRHYSRYSNPHMLYRGSYYGNYPPPRHHGPSPLPSNMVDPYSLPQPKDDDQRNHAAQDRTPASGSSGNNSFQNNLHRGRPSSTQDHPGVLAWDGNPPPQSPLTSSHYRNAPHQPRNQYQRYRHPDSHTRHSRLPPPEPFAPAEPFPPPSNIQTNSHQTSLLSSQLRPQSYSHSPLPPPIPMGFNSVPPILKDCKCLGFFTSQSPLSCGTDFTSEGSKRNQQCDIDKPILPPLANGNESANLDYSSAYTRESKNGSYIKSEFGKKDKEINSSRSSTGEKDSLSDMEYPPSETHGAYKQSSHKDEQNKPPYSNDELLSYELPTADILNRCIDTYYASRHINDQILPSKECLLKRVHLKWDSAIWHALIATVCHEKNSKVNTDEKYWISKAFKYWDDLNDFGMLLAYGLISTVPSIENNFKKAIDINKKMWNIIDSNNYISILKNKLHELLNARQAYESEIINRLIWNYWSNNLITLRFKYGYPFYKLSTIDPDFKLKYEIDQYTNSCPLPLSDEDHLNLIGKRMQWGEFNSKDIPKSSLSDRSCVIYSLMKLESVMNKIANKELYSLEVFDDIFIDHISSNYMTRESSGSLVAINSSFLSSNFAIHTANCLQSSYFLNKIIIFNDSLRSPERLVEKFTLMNDFSTDSLVNLEDLPTAIDMLTDFQWKCLLTLIYSVNEIIALIDWDKLDQKSDLVFGVTNTSNGEKWPERLDLAVSKKDIWLKFSGFSLIACCKLLPIFTSLVILTKFVNFEVETDSVSVKLLKSETAKRISPDLKSTQLSRLSNFTTNHLLNNISVVTSFIKTKIESENEALAKETMTKINKLSHYLEEVLNSFK